MNLINEIVIGDILKVLKEIPGPERIRVEEVIKYVERCPVPAELLDAHNRAAAIGEKK